MLNIVFESSTKHNMLHNDKCIENGVACIGYALDIGDISENNLIFGRPKEFFRLEFLKYDDRQLETIFREQTKDAELVLKTIKTGGDIRIWRSLEPHNICAFAFLCDIMYGYNINVYCIDLPSEYPSWSLLETKRYSDMLSKTYLLNRDEIKEYRNRWRELKKENAPLRAIVNGKITSVSEGFYDFVINKNFSSKECSIGEALGNIARVNNLRVSLNWLFARMKMMIEVGKIEIVSICEQDPLATIIKFRCKK